MQLAKAEARALAMDHWPEAWAPRERHGWMGGRGSSLGHPRNEGRAARVQWEFRLMTEV